MNLNRHDQERATRNAELRDDAQQDAKAARREASAALHRAEELATHAHNLLREMGHRQSSGQLTMRQERLADRVRHMVDEVRRHSGT